MTNPVTNPVNQIDPSTLRTCVYALHIGASPEKVWEALTSNDFIQKYWQGEWRFESDWQTGSELHYYDKDGKLYSTGQVVLSEPPYKLSYTWPEPEESRVLPEPECLNWEIAQTGPNTVKLTLVHENLTEAYFKGVSEGWSAILSSMKSLLENGVELEFYPHEQQA